MSNPEIVEQQRLCFQSGLHYKELMDKRAEYRDLEKYLLLHIKHAKISADNASFFQRVEYIARLAKIGATIALAIMGGFASTGASVTINTASGIATVGGMAVSGSDKDFGSSALTFTSDVKIDALKEGLKSEGKPAAARAVGHAMTLLKIASDIISLINRIRQGDSASGIRSARRSLESLLERIQARLRQLDEALTRCVERGELASRTA